MKTLIVSQKKGNPNVLIGPGSSVDKSALLIVEGQSRLVFCGANYVGRNVEIGPLDEIKVGRYASIQDRCILLGDIEIGAGTLLAANVYISSGRHYYDIKPTWNIKDQDELVRNDGKLFAQHSKKVIIGEDCWIGMNSVIMSGITIGKGSIIGSNTVVTKDVEPYSIVGGVPAKLLKKRVELQAVHKLHCLNDDDLPYFYKGFFTRQEDLKADRLRGGIATASFFQLFLSFKDKFSLSMSLINLSNEPLTLKHKENMVRLVPGYNGGVFFNLSPEDKIHSFHILENIDLDKVVLIEEIILK